MSLIELFLLAAGLSMDAFAVSVCKGLSMQKMRAKHALVIGLYFGGFQASCLESAICWVSVSRVPSKRTIIGLRLSCLASSVLTW